MLLCCCGVRLLELDNACSILLWGWTPRARACSYVVVELGS